MTDVISSTTTPKFFASIVAGVSNQAESELERRGVTLENADEWEEITYAEDPMAVAENVLYMVEFRKKDGSDRFRVEAVLNSLATFAEIVVETPARVAGNRKGSGISSDIEAKQ
jgi:hypothetical protein